MPSTRRSLLCAGALGLSGLLAGCSGSRGPSESETTGTGRTTRIDNSTADGTTTRDPVTRQPTERARRRAIEFVHESPVLDSGVADAETEYFARVFRTDDEVRELDVSDVRSDFEGQDGAAVERFVGATTFREHALVAVQMEMPSPSYGLTFTLLDRWGPPQIVVHTDHREGRNRKGKGPVTSTLLLRVPSHVPDSLTVAAVDVAGVHDGPLGRTTTFEVGNDRLAESINADPIDSLPSPGGALVGSREDATRLLPDEEPYSGFVRETDFGRSYLLAAQAAVPSGGFYAWPASAVRANGTVTVRVRQYPFGGGPNAVFDRLLLARLPGTVPARGTATVRTLRSNWAVRTASLSSDPADW